MVVRSGNLTNNSTVGERAEAKTLRANIQAEQARKRAFERQVASTSKNPTGGPGFSSSVEPQPALTRPRIITPG
jgi:hypothetical protein